MYRPRARPSAQRRPRETSCVVSYVLSPLQQAPAQPARRHREPVGGQPVPQHSGDRGCRLHAGTCQARDQSRLKGTEAASCGGGEGRGAKVHVAHARWRHDAPSDLPAVGRIRQVPGGADCAPHRSVPHSLSAAARVFCREPADHFPATSEAVACPYCSDPAIRSRAHRTSLPPAVNLRLNHRERLMRRGRQRCEICAS